MKQFVFLISILTVSCAKPISSNSMAVNWEEYTEMSFVKSPDTPCQILLKDEQGNLYEELNIQSKIKALNLQKNVWLKFSPLRKASVCGAQPIEILDMRQK